MKKASSTAAPPGDVRSLLEVIDGAMASFLAACSDRKTLTMEASRLDSESRKCRGQLRIEVGARAAEIAEDAQALWTRKCDIERLWGMVSSAVRLIEDARPLMQKIGGFYD